MLESGPAVDLQKMLILAKKNQIFRWSSFWSCRVCTQANLSHLGHRKSARIHWKTDARKTSHSLVRILVQRHNWTIFFENEEGETVTVNGDRYRAMWNDFCFWFLKIALSAAELISFVHLGAAIWHRWTIICGVPSKISVTTTSQR